MARILGPPVPRRRHYFNGMSDQYQFFSQFEDQIGVGMWYDF